MGKAPAGRGISLVSMTNNSDGRDSGSHTDGDTDQSNFSLFSKRSLTLLPLILPPLPYEVSSLIPLDHLPLFYCPVRHLTRHFGSEIPHETLLILTNRCVSIGLWLFRDHPQTPSVLFIPKLFYF